jgi:hypothetical protein
MRKSKSNIKVESQKSRLPLMLTFLFIAFVVSACSNNNSTNRDMGKNELGNEEKQTEGVVIPITYVNDLSLLKEKLPESDYYYAIKIVKIEFEEIKNAYTYKADKYAVGEPINGIKLIVTFTMTNPYNKEMADVPISTYYRLTTPENLSDEGLDGGNGVSLNYVEKTKRNVLIHNGQEVKKYIEPYTLNFRPNEAKEFKVVLPHFISTVSKVVFWEFSDSTNVNDLKWGWAQIKQVETGIEIDVKSKSILSQLRKQSYNRTQQIVQKVVANEVQ